MPGAKMLGNRAASYIKGSGINGIGAAATFKGALGWIGLSGKAGDVAYLNAGDCTTHFDQGYFFQTTGGAALSFTLQDPAIACNPDPQIQATVAWVDLLTLAPADGIVQRVKAFASLKVEFTAAGEVYIVSR